MTSPISIRLTALMLSGLALSGAAVAGSTNAVTLDPGLYDFKTDIYVSGQLQKTDEYEYCLIEGRNSKTLDQIVGGLVEGGGCAASNVIFTQSTGSADMSCLDPDFGMRITGRVEADYGTTYYNAHATANMGGPTLSVKTKVRRRGDCPEGWDNPDDVSPD